MENGDQSAAAGPRVGGGGAVGLGPMASPGASSPGDWTGRMAVVTGAASGIGLAVSARLRALRADVVMVDLPGAALEAAVASVAGATAIAVDLADPGAVHSLDGVLDSADTVVNNAGLGALVPIDELDDQRWHTLLTVMLTAPFMLTRAALPGMIARDFGRIVNISSVYGHIAGTRRAAYVSAKHGILGLTKATAVEAAAAGATQVTANAVCPSYVRTGALERMLAEQAAVRGLTEDEVAAEFMSRNLVKRLVEPAQIAEMVAFLARPDMWSVNGQSVLMDAGWLST
jgi:3-hydroxybutyrate dehydrogenase